MAFPTVQQLLNQTLAYKRPSEADALRHSRALELLADLKLGLCTLAQGNFDFPAIGAHIGDFTFRLPEVIDVNTAFPEGTEVVRILNRVRMCATRYSGAKSATGTSTDWGGKMVEEMRNLELALATAIVATPTAE